MLSLTKIQNHQYLELEKRVEQLTRLEQQHLSLVLEISQLKSEIKTAIHLAEFEESLYSGIKKIFK